VAERKPTGVSWETWVERQIRQAQERGAFDDLPGAGKPIPGRGEAYDELWWVKQKLARENVSFTPPGLALRKEVEDALEGLGREGSESAVRALVTRLNDKIVDANRKAMSGPAPNLMPLDEERVVSRWREQLAATAAADDGPAGRPAPSGGAGRSSGRRSRRYPRRPSR
jgi:hypothetical protein